MTSFSEWSLERKAVATIATLIVIALVALLTKSILDSHSEKLTETSSVDFSTIADKCNKDRSDGGTMAKLIDKGKTFQFKRIRAEELSGDTPITCTWKALDIPEHDLDLILDTAPIDGPQSLKIRNLTVYWSTDTAEVPSTITNGRSKTTIGIANIMITSIDENFSRDSR